MANGIDVRHQRQCRSRAGGRCNCEPTYQARVWDNATGQRICRTFTNETAAKAWRRDAKIALRRGREVAAGSRQTVAEAVNEWVDLARRGVVRNRSGEPYKPSAVRGYEQNLRLRVLPELGPEPVSDLRRVDLQELVDELVGSGLAPATVQSSVIPLKAIMRRLVEQGKVERNPTEGLRLPAVRSRRERIATAVEAKALIAAVPERDRAIWATAFYTGLRRGELQALPAELIDLEQRVIHVRYGWDFEAGRIETKGRNRRRVPIPETLRVPLAAHLLASGRRGGELAFGAIETRPFYAEGVQRRADEAWGKELERVTFHECRHTFAALSIAAGVNAKALQSYMGHASIQTTFDLYGHLMPGSESEAAGLLDAYLAGASG